jgi:DNA mismatch repair protein MSH3
VTNRLWQCTPKELSVLLPAFDKIGTSFDNVDPENPESIGLASKLLKSIICSLPRVRAPVKKLLGIVNLKKAAEGKKEMMWNDPERYPAIIDSDMVSEVTRRCVPFSFYDSKVFASY